MSVYRFPKHQSVDEYSQRQAHEKIGEELLEAVASYSCNYDVTEEYGMELMDVIHATETAIRMMFTDEEAEELRAKVIAKNANRGYYKTVDS